MTDDEFLILERGVRGVCVRGVWKYYLDGRAVGRAVKRLENAGLISITYHSGHSSGWPTVRGSYAASVRKLNIL